MSHDTADNDRWRRLMRQAQAGNVDAFEQIYLLSARWLLAQIRPGVGGADEEVLAETFTEAWRTIGSYDQAHASPAEWLSALARNCALNHQRSAKEGPPGIPSNEADCPASPSLLGDLAP